MKKEKGKKNAVMRDWKLDKSVGIRSFKWHCWPFACKINDGFLMPIPGEHEVWLNGLR